MRRLRILFYWLLYHKNNISFNELIAFLKKPKVNIVAKKYIDNILKVDDYYHITFKQLDKILYWPKKFKVEGINQIVAETFDVDDWHYYQKEHTKIESGEILLDIGSAEGLFPLTVVDKCKHIYMIEPSATFYKTLKKTFFDYQEKVTIFNSAIGNENGLIFFNEDSLQGYVSDVENIKTKSLNISKIDSLLKDVKITYLKADIEGFEEEMLIGAEQIIKKNKPKIAITTYHPQNNPEDIIKIITGFVPEYQYYVKGIYEESPKPVMIHFWI